MRKVLGVFCAVLICGALATSQQSASKNGSENQNQPTDLRTVVGCLSKTANTYVITGGGPGPKEFRVVGGDTAMLKGKIGQTVKVVGPVGEADPADVAAPPYNEGSTTGVTYETIVAQKVKVMGGLCSNPGQEWKGDHE